MALKIHRADHPNLLVDALVDVIAPARTDPFAPEIIAVPTRGIDRWLTERIGESFAQRGIGDGIAANITLPFPHRLAADILSRVPGTAESVTAWRTRSVVAHLEQIVDEQRDAPWMRLITRFVDGPDGDGAGAQRLRAAQKIARLFGAYARHRPGMIAAWGRGEDGGPDGRPIEAAAAWQPTLWRLLAARIGTPPPGATMPDALAAIRAGEVDTGLTERVSIYGVTAIDRADLAVFDALSNAVDVHLFLLHASPAMWDAAAPLIPAAASAVPPILRSEDPTADVARHPLLRSWAQESRELQIVVGAFDGSDLSTSPTPDTPTRTLLGTLQSDIRANREPTRNAPDGSPDRTIQIHACHGPVRQVEVLRDAILHLLADDPTLEPRDVVIMTPDLATYAPLIEAAFPARSDAADTLPDLRVRIADRSPTRTNPLLRFAATVVELAGSRLSRGTVTQLLGLPETQRSLGIGIDTVSEIESLIDDANIRWGLDADHRDRHGAGHRDEHTWRRGNDRILGGIFFDDDPIRIVGDIAPLTRVEGGTAQAAGTLALFVERLAAISRLLGERGPTSRWAENVSTAVRLIAEPDRDDRWQWGQLERLLAESFPDDPTGPDPEIGADDAALLIAPWTEDRPGRLHHRTGDLTVGTLAPMRSVPYRVVCLLGMEDERFPRTGRSDGDDLLGADERIGDPDRSAEDRQLLLDALMAAGDHLLITYSGRDPLTNAAYPPAVPIAELLETVTAMTGPEPPGSIVTAHPLQPFSPHVFTDGRLGVPGPWGFDPIQYAGAQALLGDARDEEDAAAVAVDPHTVGPPTLDQLVAYLKAPSKTFLRRSLGMFIPDIDGPPDDELPTGLGGLERWAVTNRFLSGIRRGYDGDRLTAYERAADTVPAGALASEPLGDAFDVAVHIEQTAGERGCAAGPFTPVTGTVAIPGGSISGSVLADESRGIVCDASPSRVKAARRLAMYAHVVFLTALHPEREWTGIIIGKGDKAGTLAVVTIGPVPSATSERRREAGERLADLVGLYHAGMTQPLPIFPESSYAWHAAEPPDRRYRTAQQWEPQWGGLGDERDEPAHRLLFPDLHTVDDLLATDFPRYAGRLWSPIGGISMEETL